MSRRFLARPVDPATLAATTVAPSVTADREAQLYRQTWQSVLVPQSRWDFSVLAFDRDEARTLGEYRLVGMGIDGAMRLMANSPTPWQRDLVASVLEVERSEETDTRHMAHSRREANKVRRG